MTGNLNPCQKKIVTPNELSYSEIEGKIVIKRLNYKKSPFPFILPEIF
jgi:hypothetical protein